MKLLILNDNFNITRKDYSFYIKDGKLFSKMSRKIKPKLKLEYGDYYNCTYKKYYITIRNNLQFHKYDSIFYMPRSAQMEQHDFIKMKELNKAEKAVLRRAIFWACKTYNKILNVE